MTTPKQPPKNEKTATNGLPSHIGGVAVPAFLQKIPLPILGGIVAFIGMVLYVFILAATTPLPGEGAAPASPPPPAAAAPAPENNPSSMATSPAHQDGTATPSAPTENGGSGIPAYQGPQGAVASMAGGLPLIPRMNAPQVQDLGRQVVMSQAEFQAATRAENAPSGMAAAIAYTLRVPKEFTAVESGVNRELPVQSGVQHLLAEYLSPSDHTGLHSYVRVRAEKMLHAVPLIDWVQKYALDQRVTFHALTVHGADRVETLHVTTQGNNSVVIRTAFVMNGDQILVAEYGVPAERFEQEKDMQTWVVASFYPPQKVQGSSEPLKTYRFYDLVRFDAYQSWQAQNQNISNPQTMSLSLANTRPSERIDGTAGQKLPEILQGRVDVFVFSRDLDPATFSVDGYIQKWFGLQQLQLSSAIGRFDAPSPLQPGISLARAQVYNVANVQGNSQNYQYFMAEIGSRDYSVVVGLLTPPAAGDPYNWARNQMAFDRVVQSIHQGN